MHGKHTTSNSSRASESAKKFREQPMNDIDTPARIEYLHVKNYRALKDIKLDKMTPLTSITGAKRQRKIHGFRRFCLFGRMFFRWPA